MKTCLQQEIMLSPIGPDNCLYGPRVILMVHYKLQESVVKVHQNGLRNRPIAVGILRGSILCPNHFHIFVHGPVKYILDSNVFIFVSIAAIYYCSDDSMDLQLALQNDPHSISR